MVRVVEVDEEPPHQRLGKGPPPDSREDGLDEPPPEPLLVGDRAPRLHSRDAAGRDLAPGGADSQADLGNRGGHAVGGEGPRVDVFHRRLGPEKGVARVEENRLEAGTVQGITWPPSMTIACPVTFAASVDAR